MRLALDSNVLLDVFLERPEFFQYASRLLAAVETGKCVGVIGATTVTTIFYLARKKYDRRKATLLVEHMLRLLEVAPVNGAVLAGALQLGYSDYEDAVITQACLSARVHGIVTRNPKDFRKCPLPVFTPEQALQLVEA